MMRASLLVLAAACVSTVSAQFRTTWFGNATCQGGFRTLVIGQPSLCQRVPDSQTLGYKVECGADNAGGVYSVCEDAQCGNCAVNTPFTNDQCLDNPPEFGSASVSLTCATNAGTQPIPQAPAGTATITWFQPENCQAGTRTVVVAQSDVCETVPQGTQGGYKVQCNTQGTGGVFQVCDTNACGVCGVTTPFTNDQCLPNPPQFGAASVSIRCTAGTANPSTGPSSSTPAPAASQGGGGGGSGAASVTMAVAAAAVVAAAVAQLV